MPDRFSEEEAQRIFARAAERQHADAARPPGLSRAELEEIGRAAGLDPRHVAAAVDEVRAGAPAEPTATFLGVDVEPRATRVLPGPVTDETWEQMVARLRRTFKSKGTPTDVGRHREWTSGPGSNLHVVVEPVDGGTRVTLETSKAQESRGMWTFPIVGVLLIGLFLAIGVAEGDAADPALWAFLAFWAVFGVAGALVPRVLFDRWAARRRRQFDALLDQFELVVRETTPVEATADAVPEVPPALDLDALADPPAEAREPRRRERS